MKPATADWIGCGMYLALIVYCVGWVAVRGCQAWKAYDNCVTIGHMDPQTCKDALGL